MLEQLMIFVKIIQTGSISAAAKQLNTTPSKISRAIKKLEETLNVSLLLRDSWRVIPSDIGSNLYSACHKNINELVDILDDFSFLYNNKEGELKLLTMPSVFKNLILPNLSDFIEKNPKLNLHTTHYTSDISFFNDNFDIAITAILPTKESLILKKYFIAYPILCASKKFVDKYGQPKTIADLKDFTLINSSMYNIEAFQWTIVENSSPTNQQIVKIKQHHITTHNNMLNKDIALHGLGVTPVFDYAIVHELQSGELIQILPEYRLPATIIYLIKPNKFESMKLKVLTDFLFKARDLFIEENPSFKQRFSELT